MKYSFGFEFLVQMLRQMIDKPNEKIKNIKITQSNLRKSIDGAFYRTIDSKIYLTEENKIRIKCLQDPMKFTHPDDIKIVAIESYMPRNKTQTLIKRIDQQNLLKKKISEIRVDPEIKRELIEEFNMFPIPILNWSKEEENRKREKWRKKKLDELAEVKEECVKLTKLGIFQQEEEK